MFDKKITSLFSFSGENSSLAPKLYESVPIRFTALQAGTANFLNILKLDLPAEPAERPSVENVPEVDNNVVDFAEYKKAKAEAGQAGARTAIGRVGIEDQIADRQQQTELQRIRQIVEWEADQNGRRAA